MSSLHYLDDPENARRHRIRQENEELKKLRRRAKMRMIEPLTNAERLARRAKISKAKDQFTQTRAEPNGQKVQVYHPAVYGKDLKRSKEAPKKKPVAKKPPAPFGDRPKYRPGLRAEEFYRTREWMEVRYATIRKYGAVCMCCNATKVTLHVDHIKPRSQFPALELDPENLQVLCETCNIGKSNKDHTDWRTKGSITQTG